MKMRKIVAVLMTALMLCCIIPFSAMADGTSATISFADLANRESCTTEQQVWKQNGITVINNKADSTSDVNEKYFNPARFYKNSDVIVEYAGMTKIDFNCNSASYATTLAGAIEGAVVNGNVVSVTLDGVDSFTCTMSAGQVRMDSITVYTGDAPVTPDEPDVPVDPTEDPEADTELSIADAIALGASKEHNTYTEGKYFVTGTITEVYNTQYGNMYITDGNGNTLLIYGTYSADGSARYDAMEVQPVAGDVVTIYGMVGQYNGTAQIKNGWITAHTAGGATPDVPVEPDEPETPNVTVVTNPVAAKAYKFALEQTQKGALYFFTGAMSGYYGATDTDISKAVDMYLENSDLGYKMFFIDASGVKQYIKLEQSGTHYNFTFGPEGSEFTLDGEKNALCAPCGDQICYMGTYGSYVTVGCLTTDKLSETDYIARLYTVGGETPDEPDVPAEDTLTIEQAIALGQTMEHNVFTEEKYYVTGVITEVYNEMYGNMKLTDDAGNILTIYGTWSADGTLRYDALEVKPVAGDTVTVYGIVGQYNGTSQVKNGWIVAHTAAGGETPDEPEVPVEPDEPAVEVEIATELKEGVAYKLAMNQLEKGALYFFTGAMSGYYGATETDIALAVDMYIEIVDGGYNLYFNDANGDKQYIALVQSGTHYNFTFGPDASVFSWDAERNALYATAGDMVCYMGTYGSYVTVGTLKQDMLSETDYFARLYVEKVETPDEPSEPGTETPDEPGTDSPATGDNTTVYVTLAVVLMALSAAALVVTKKRA